MSDGIEPFVVDSIVLGKNITIPQPRPPHPHPQPETPLLGGLRSPPTLPLSDTHNAAAVAARIERELGGADNIDLETAPAPLVTTHVPPNALNILHMSLVLCLSASMFDRMRAEAAHIAGVGVVTPRVPVPPVPIRRQLEQLTNMCHTEHPEDTCDAPAKTWRPGHCDHIVTALRHAKEGRARLKIFLADDAFRRREDMVSALTTLTDTLVAGFSDAVKRMETLLEGSSTHEVGTEITPALQHAWRSYADLLAAVASQWCARCDTDTARITALRNTGELVTRGLLNQIINNIEHGVMAPTADAKASTVLFAVQSQLELIERGQEPDADGAARLLRMTPQGTPPQGAKELLAQFRTVGMELLAQFEHLHTHLSDDTRRRVETRQLLLEEARDTLQTQVDNSARVVTLFLQSWQAGERVGVAGGVATCHAANKKLDTTQRLLTEKLEAAKKRGEIVVGGEKLGGGGDRELHAAVTEHIHNLSRCWRGDSKGGGAGDADSHRSTRSRAIARAEAVKLDKLKRSAQKRSPTVLDAQWRSMKDTIDD